MIENHMPGNLYNELFSESSEQICTAFQRMSWSLIVYKNTIFPSIFLPVSLSLYPLFPFFHKGEDTSTIPQPSVHHLVYVFLLVFSFL